jgi:hypothetical protein
MPSGSQMRDEWALKPENCQLNGQVLVATWKRCSGTYERRCKDPLSSQLVSKSTNPEKEKFEVEPA